MRAHAVRLTPGADLKAELERLTEACGLRAGCVLSCVGSLSSARLRMPGTAGDAEVVAAFAEPMEIVSLAGTLAPTAYTSTSAFRDATAPASAGISSRAASCIPPQRW